MKKYSDVKGRNKSEKPMNFNILSYINEHIKRKTSISINFPFIFNNSNESLTNFCEGTMEN